MSVYKKPRVAEGQTALVAVDEALGASKNTQDILVDRRMELRGHRGAVLCSRFSSGDGSMIASGGVDKNIFLWNTPSTQNLQLLQAELKSYGARLEQSEGAVVDEVPVNFAVLKGHKSAVTSLRWNNTADRLVSASADKTCGYWDVMRIQRLRKFVCKKSRKASDAAAVINEVEFVNGYDEDNNLFASCSDDGFLRLWDVRESSEVAQAGSEYPLLTVHNPCKSALKGQGSNTMIFTAGVEAVIYGFDVRMLKEPRMRIETLHQDSITGLSSSQSVVKDVLVSSSADGTVRFYDYGDEKICSTYFSKPGHNSSYLSRCVWRNLDEFNEMIVSGTADGLVGVWNSENELGFLKHDDDAIIDCDIHPIHSNVVMASSANGNLYLEEI